MYDDQISTSKAIQRRTGPTFHAATRLLPERARHATYVLYAFSRIADEVVDAPDTASPAVQLQELERIQAAVLDERETDDPVLSAFGELRERSALPDAEIETFIDAMCMDVSKDRYDTHADLDAYLRGSSVAVAYMMLAVMEPDDPEVARPHAKALGEAFQLTNFLRDVREDVLDHGRIYLPHESLAAYGVSEDDVERLRFSEEFAAVVRSELLRTEALYREGVAGIRYLPEDCQFGVLLAAVLYAEHHRLIRARGYDVLSARPTLSAGRRLALVARTWWRWRRSRDPVATFEAVSAVPADPGANVDEKESAPGGKVGYLAGVARSLGAGSR